MACSKLQQYGFWRHSVDGGINGVHFISNAWIRLLLWGSGTPKISADGHAGGQFLFPIQLIRKYQRLKI
jgi:hypothetical protein